MMKTDLPVGGELRGSIRHLSVLEPDSFAPACAVVESEGMSF